MLKNWPVRNKIIYFVLTFILLMVVFNHIKTFNGFIPRTETERKACEIIKIRQNFSNASGGIVTDAWTEWVEKMSESNYKIYSDYKIVIGDKSCKSINQFYIEELGLVFIAVFIFFVSRKFHFI